ncbi:MAG TPA: HlyD family secretion protein [Anaeromyxobacteraceae bacterium]|nr:HlyD family secretion protein [Anaeromyxobacteraceae bacterium]
MAEPAARPPRGEARPEAAEGSPPEEPASRPPWKKRRALLTVAAIAVVVVLGVLVYVLLHAGKESTDDAQVDADVVPLSARVQGQVANVPAGESQPVRKGDVILQLDDRDHRARVAQAAAEVDAVRAQADAADSEEAVAEAAARGSLTQAESDLVGSTRSVAGARAQLEQARAGLPGRDADLALAQANLRRARELQRGGSIAQQQVDQAQAQDEAARAAKETARASVQAAEEQLRRARAQVGESRGRVVVSRPVEARIAGARASAAYQQARLRSAEAALALARLNLEWTRIVAPDDGMVSGITAHPSAFVAVGQTVAQFVPRRKYVTANFKETQIARMRVGQPADVDVDTYGRTVHGKVASLSAGTGARFSLLPPENATGNFVKVAQRIPVRIALDGVPDGMTLRAGQSVNVTVHLRE